MKGRTCSADNLATEEATAAAAGPDVIDTAIAAFIVVFGVGFLIMSSVAMVLFFRERRSFEIKARSAYLSLLNGLCFMAVLVVIVVRELPNMFLRVKVHTYASFTVKFFATVCGTCAYGSRTLLLLVRCCYRARKTAPWLSSERNHVLVCILLGLASMAVPLYDMTHVSDDSSVRLEYSKRVREHYWIVTFLSLAIVLLLNPIAWKIDDLFGIGPELRVMMVVQLVLTVVGKLSEDCAAREVLRWIGPQNLGFLYSIIMISLSIISPIIQRLHHPLQSSDPKVIKAFARRRAAAEKQGTPVGAQWCSVSSATDIEDGSTCSRTRVSSTRYPSACNSPAWWSYEKVMMRPESASALEQFSRKALCHESFLFLKDATAFQAQTSREAVVTDADDRKFDCEIGYTINSKSDELKGRHRGNSDEGIQEDFMFFSKIVHEYIADGAPNEINISSRDRSDILDVYNNKRGGCFGFYDLSAAERRLIFARVYAEIRFMLESNLILRFIATNEMNAAPTSVWQ